LEPLEPLEPPAPGTALWTALWTALGGVHRRPERLGETMAQRVLAALALRGGAHLLLVQLQL